MPIYNYLLNIMINFISQYLNYLNLIVMNLVFFIFVLVVISIVVVDLLVIF
jgi:hypothetical protein